MFKFQHIAAAGMQGRDGRHLASILSATNGWLLSDAQRRQFGEIRAAAVAGVSRGGRQKGPEDPKLHHSLLDTCLADRHLISYTSVISVSKSSHILQQLPGGLADANGRGRLLFGRYNRTDSRDAVLIRHSGTNLLHCLSRMLGGFDHSLGPAGFHQEIYKPGLAFRYHDHG